MKMIDLLLIISKGFIPNKIEFDNKIWYLQEDFIYCSEGISLEEYCNILQCLNETIKIIKD